MPRRNQSSVPPKINSAPLSSGDWVEVAGFSGLGQILEIDFKRSRARVQHHGAIITTAPDKLARAAPPAQAAPSNLVRVVGRSAMQYEIDLHGMRVEEAVSAVDRALDQAVVNHLETFRIVHGHGTGALRNAIRELLKHHPHVTDYRFGEPHEGGLACTVAHLKPIRK